MLMIPPALVHAAPQVMDFSPRAGNAGTVIIIQGAGFGTNEGAVSAKVGGVTAGVVSVSEVEVRLNAPAATGTVEVTVNGESSVSLLPFTATRTVSGTFVPPAGMNAAGYYTGSLRAPTVGLAFSVSVSQTTVDAVWAWRGENDPMFGALVFPGTVTVQMDATSTALAMLGLSPAAPKADPVAVNEFLARVAGSAELAAVTSLIQQAGAGGYNWMEDTRFSQSYGDLLIKAVTLPPQGNGNGGRAFVHPGTGLVHTLTPTRGVADLRLKYGITNAPDGNLQLKVSPSDTHPTRLTQNVEIWRVNPSWFTDGFDHIERMNFSDLPTLLDAVPRGTGYVSAKLGSANLDVTEWIGKTVSSMIFGDLFKVDGDAKFSLPRATPGVYIVNSYSGNYWYGLANIDPLASQSGLLSQIDVNHQWRDAVITNLMIQGVDFASVILPDFKVIGSDELGKIIKSVSTKVAKTITAYVAANGSMDLYGAAQVSRAAFTGIFKACVSILVGEAAGASWTGPVESFVGASLKILKAQLSALSKLSNFLQGVERGASLNLPTHFAVERAVVTVGDPFAPAITSFHPPSGRAGDYITISGEFLPSSAAGYEVNFITFAGTGAPPPINARLPATVVSAALGTWMIKAPNAALWQTAFGSGDHFVFLGIKNTVTGGESVTSANPGPNYQWRYRAPPQLTGVSPNPARSSGMLTVEGVFDAAEDRDIYAEIDGQDSGSSLTVSSSRVHFRVYALSQGVHSLRLVYRDSGYQFAGASNAVNFTVNDPFPPIVADAPRKLYVTLRNMSNVPDGELTLYEAMAIAAGTLGRNLTVRPAGQSQNDYESDWVEFPQGVTGSYGEGSAIRDTVTIANFATGPALQNLTAALPLPGEGDYLGLGGIIFDGAGTPPGTIGWDLRGARGHYLNGSVEFRNFSGGGIVAGNGAQWNTVSSATITNCGGDGILLSGEVSDNYFIFTKVHGSPGVGVRLSGTGVFRNEFASAQAIPLQGPPDVMRVTNSGSHGLLIEGGASGNVVDIWESRGNGGDGIRLSGTGTAGNYIGGAFIPGFRDAAGNTGHGLSILAGAIATVVQNVAAGANGGDGFRIEGPGTSHNQLRSIATGFDYSAAQLPAFVSRNGGFSVRIVNSPFNVIGTRNRGFFINSPECALGGSNGGATVLITGAGSHHNSIDSSGFGYMEPYAAPANTPAALLLAPAATHGLHLTGGAHDNVIGHSVSAAGVYFLATPDGAALLIEGAGTDNNHVLGCRFGRNRTDLTLANQQVRRGVHILNGPRGNRIGEVGNQRPLAGAQPALQPYNSFGAITEAAIRLEGVQSGANAAGANVVVNNRMGFNVLIGDLPPQHPEVGIHLLNQVSGQWIGGLTKAEGNQISRYGYAGLWIENGNILSYDDRNRISANLTNTGLGTTSPGANNNAYNGPVLAQGLLVTGGTGQVIGEDWAVFNQFNGARACAYLEGGTGHWLRAAWMDNGAFGGLFVHNGTGHRFGGVTGEDLIRSTRGGTAGDDNTAGIILAGGGGHRVEGCIVGDRGTVDTIWGSRGHGVLIHESSGNRIGGTQRAAGNLIVRSGGDGVVIRGAASTGNQIGHNKIGTGTLLSPNPGNTGSGIRFTAGAHDNLVGGGQIPAGLPGFAPLVPAGNTIHGNGGDGVQVFGAATTGNTISLNSTWNNTGLGIRHVSDGNHLHPPPATVFAAANGRITGHVASLAVTPAGSRIEAFSTQFPDTDKEGADYGGSGVVRPDGTFSFRMIGFNAPGSTTVTATHAVTGDTSEFKGAEAQPDESFGFSLAVPQGESLQIKDWPAGTPFSAVVLTAAARGATVDVRTLKIKTLGTGAFAASLAGVSLFEDVDRNGVHSAPDRELAPLAAFTGGEAELNLEDAFVSDGENRRWVLRLHPAAGVPPGGTVRLEITDAIAVGEYYLEPLGATGVLAVFPLQSALHQAGGVTDPRAAWRSSYGLPADGSGDGADSFDVDKDGLVNLLEYALGSSPIDGRDAARPAAARAAAPDRITFTYQKLRADVTYTVEAATATTGLWSSAGVDQGGAGPTVTASVPVSGGRKFLRLRVQ